MDDPNKSLSSPFNALIRAIFTADPDEIACDECYDQVGHYVDLLRAGQHPEDVLPQVRDHLTRCPVCEEEFKALVAILEAQVEGPESHDQTMHLNKPTEA